MPIGLRERKKHRTRTTLIDAAIAVFTTQAAAGMHSAIIRATKPA